MLWYPFIIGLGVGIGATAFIAANWEDIIVGIEAMKENHQNRRKRPAFEMEDARDNGQGEYRFVREELESDSSDTESESRPTRGKSTAIAGPSTVKQRSGDRKVLESDSLFFEMPSTANSSSSASSTTFLRPLDKNEVKNEVKNENEPLRPLSTYPSRKKTPAENVEDSGSEALLSTDDWTDTGKDIWSS